jgi:hypothetical protein
MLRAGDGMAHAFETCSNCGATVEEAADGRSIECKHCGARSARAVDPAKLAASLKTEGESIDQFLERLAKTLSEAFPEHTVVETSGGFLSAKHVKSIEVTFPDEVYRIARKGHHVEAEKKKLVRGIALKTEHPAVDAWLLGLSGALSRLSASSQSAHDALNKHLK